MRETGDVFKADFTMAILLGPSRQLGKHGHTRLEWDNFGDLPLQPSCYKVSSAGPWALPPQRRFRIPRRSPHLLKNLQNLWSPSEPLEGCRAGSPKWLLSVLVRAQEGL
jgi:hypothetical protein